MQQNKFYKKYGSKKNYYQWLFSADTPQEDGYVLDPYDVPSFQKPTWMSWESYRRTIDKALSGVPMRILADMDVEVYRLTDDFKREQIRTGIGLPF